MTNEDLKKFEALLDKREKELIDQLNRVANPNPAVPGDFEVRVPNLGNEDDENMDEMTQLNTDFAMEQELEAQLEEVRKTKQKIKDGTYGKCDNCGGEITPERLAAKPDSSLCVNCAK